MQQHAIAMVKKFFENHEIHYEMDEDFAFFATLDYGEKITGIPLIVVFKETEYVVYANFPHKIPVESMARVAELLHRANNYLPYCNFELDYFDAEVRVKSYVNFNHCEISYAIAEDSIICPLNMLSIYYTALMRTIYSNENVLDLLMEALEDVE